MRCHQGVTVYLPRMWMNFGVILAQGDTTAVVSLLVKIVIEGWKHEVQAVYSSWVNSNDIWRIFDTTAVVSKCEILTFDCCKPG